METSQVEVRDNHTFLLPVEENTPLFINKTIVRVIEKDGRAGRQTHLFDTNEIVDISLCCKKYDGDCKCEKTFFQCCFPLERYEYSFTCRGHDRDYDYVILQYFFVNTEDLIDRFGSRDFSSPDTHPPERWWAWGRILLKGTDFEDEAFHECHNSNAKEWARIIGVNEAVEWIKGGSNALSPIAGKAWTRPRPRLTHAVAPAIIADPIVSKKEEPCHVATISEMIRKANNLIKLLYRYGGEVYAPKGIVQNTLHELKVIEGQLKDHNNNSKNHKRTELFPGSNQEKTYNTLLVWSHVRDLLGDRFYTDKHLFLASSFASDASCLLDMNAPVENIIGAEISSKEHDALIENMEKGEAPVFLCINDDVSKIFVRSPHEYCSVYCDFKGTLSPKNLETVRLIVEQMTAGSVFAATFSLRAEGFHSPHDRAAAVSEVVRRASKYDYKLIQILKYVGINGTPMETYIYHINPSSEKEDPFVYDIHREFLLSDDQMAAIIESRFR